MGRHVIRDSVYQRPGCPGCVYSMGFPLRCWCFEQECEEMRQKTTDRGATKPIEPETAVIDYTNWRGERRVRRIRPRALTWTSNEWHPEKQWLLLATDVEDGQIKTFAMSGIHSWDGQTTWRRAAGSNPGEST